MNKRLVALFISTGILVVGCAGSPEPNSSDNTRIDQQTENDEGFSAPATPANNKIEAGTWKVGKKDNIPGGVITPGEYVITATEDGYGCYWQRVRNFSGEFNSIIANGNIDQGKTARVTVKSSDKGLELQNSCLAKKSK